ncbi:MAG TPA: type I methionyl aminopeptidase [Candidatus Paceibacterota bacterium]|nr:type I methionyl aminopeptidase [Candidatus Paceibacterota bacterium]
MIHLKTEKEIEILSQGGKILASILKDLSVKTIVGTNLMDLENVARDLAKKAGAYPSFLGYQPEGANKPYPAALCLSVNDVVVHGVPRNYFLKNGDVIKIDMGVVYEGLYTDSAITLAVGNVSPIARKLIASTKNALEDAIMAVKKGRTLGDIGYAIEKRAKKDGFFVLRGLTGHGVGYEVHEDPSVLNYGKKGTGVELKEGMVLALEPMFSVSSQDIIQNRDESYSSADGSLTAQFEHTVAITKKGTIVLTR